jgi:hypothetical protein
MDARTWFTPKQKAELWERWKSGQCVADIARALERRNKSGVYRILALNGGIAPAPRRRGSSLRETFPKSEPLSANNYGERLVGTELIQHFVRLCQKVLLSATKLSTH